MATSYTTEQINSLIDDGVRENVNLDYKSIGALTNNQRNKDEISKDVSGFANSAGGVLIYGVRETNHIPQDVDGGSDIVLKKEWVEQVINSNIKPPISGIIVDPVEIDEEHSVLLIRIPMSHTAHQANDHRYYHRYGSETLPMEDYQVKQTMNRVREPVLRIEPIVPEPISLPIEQANNLMKLEMILKNHGVFTAHSVMINVYLPSQLHPYTEREWNLKHLEPSQIDGCLKCNAITVEREPILLHPHQQMRISGSTVRSSLGLHLSDETAGYNTSFSGYYEIFAENMTPKYGQINFAFANSYLTITATELTSLPYV